MASKKVAAKKVVTREERSNKIEINVSTKTDYLNEVKKIKVQRMVKEICDARESVGGKYDSKISGILRLVFDYDKLNDYGKIIVDSVGMSGPMDSESKIGGIKILTSANTTNCVEVRKIFAEEFVKYCRRDSSYLRGRMDNAYYFIFWSLMVLTVDNSNKEENLSVICDFVKMFMITDEEVKDIISIIKIVYEQSEYAELSRQYPSGEYYSLQKKRAKALNECIKSSKVLRVFSELIALYLDIKGEDVANEREYESHGWFE